MTDLPDMSEFLRRVAEARRALVRTASGEWRSMGSAKRDVERETGMRGTVVNFAIMEAVGADELELSHTLDTRLSAAH